MILRATNLIKMYGSRQVVKDVSFEINTGEIVGLLGPNGAGKTTSFYMTVGFIQPDGGNVYLDEENITKLPMYRRAQKGIGFLGDEDITRLAMYKRAQKGIGYLPQEASVFRKLSVEDNIKAVLEMTELSAAEQNDKLESLIAEFNLGKVRRNNGDMLSGGERRRTEIARALATDPNFILLDEPFAAIDPIAVEDLQNIVSKLRSRNIGILITDHNAEAILSITDRAYLMFEGSILRAGTAAELATDEIVKKVYLGRDFALKQRVIY
jgi:lipopolysaccharide export system ATP-binding protein